MALGVAAAVIASVFVFGRDDPDGRLERVRERVEPQLRSAVGHAGFHWGAPIFIRIFKEESELELFLFDSEIGKFRLFASWPVAYWGSGSLGPKLAEGDGQAPEGFYAVAPRQMNPKSRFHLAFDLGFPNSFDRHHDRTGSFLMVHGDRRSIGCYAMTDPVIEKIYLLADAAHHGGQCAFPVHCFPFRMTDERMASAAGSPHAAFWRNLKLGCDHFESTGIPPVAAVDPESGQYQFEAGKTPAP